jgi:TM2 domain-containing membrane protein YozV
MILERISSEDIDMTTTICCANHPEIPVASFCRTCGKPLCAACRRPVAGTIFCEAHAPATTSAKTSANASSSASTGASGSYSSSYTPPVNDSPYTAPLGAVPPSKPSPAVAFLFGMIPGVGAIYNGQYAKGLVHAVFFGLLITAISSSSLRGWEPLLGIMIGVFFFYMALEAYHTARKRQSGEVVEEFSSLMGGGEDGFPTGAVVLIGVGALLLLNTLDLISIDVVVRFWPVGLIAIGAYMLYSRMKGGTR